MISKECFDKYFIHENVNLSRENLYKIYQYLITIIQQLEEDFQFKEKTIWKKDFQLGSQRLSDYVEFYNTLGVINYWKIQDYKNTNSFWMITKLVDNINLKYIRDNILHRGNAQLTNYINIVLNHLIPKNKKYINIYVNELIKREKEREQEKEQKCIIIEKEKKNCGGIYGIYENGKLVYIGMTMRDFEVRWEEHKQGIKNKSNQLIFYSLIDQNSKIEFKKIIELEKIEANSKITKRDLQAMELALIQEHKPKYNFAGKSQAYIF